MSQFRLSPLYEAITFCSDLWLGRGLKQTCSSRQEISNNVSHSTSTHHGRVDSRILMVGSQIANLIVGLSFWHNLCCICPNGSCEPIFDIYTLITFHWYKECLNARCSGPYNRTLKFWKSWWTLKSPIRECECHPPTLPKVGLWRSLARNTIEG
jgi:hypothetical protein